MRTLTIIMIVAAAGMLFGDSGERTVHRSEDVTSRDGRTVKTNLRIVRSENGPDYATWENDDREYVTRDPRVIEELLALVEKQGAVSREHAELGRRHAELGHEHARLSHEIARAGKDEVRRRELERKQQELDRKRQELDRQRQSLERNRQDNAAIDAIFERAVKAGKAKRD